MIATTIKHRLICPKWKCYTNLVSPYGTGTHVSSLDKFFDNMYFAKKVLAKVWLKIKLDLLHSAFSAETKYKQFLRL